MVHYAAVKGNLKVSNCTPRVVEVVPCHGTTMSFIRSSLSHFYQIVTSQISIILSFTDLYQNIPVSAL